MSGEEIEHVEIHDATTIDFDTNIWYGLDIGINPEIINEEIKENARKKKEILEILFNKNPKVKISKKPDVFEVDIQGYLGEYKIDYILGTKVTYKNYNICIGGILYGCIPYFITLPKALRNNLGIDKLEIDGDIAELISIIYYLLNDKNSTGVNSIRNQIKKIEKSFQYINQRIFFVSTTAFTTASSIFTGWELSGNNDNE